MTTEASLQIYFQEADEMLEQMESLLLKFDKGEVEDEAESLNAIFRAAHTIKGSASIFNLNDIVGFTHVAENVLDGLRAGKNVLDERLISILLLCCDHIAILLEHAKHQNSDNQDTPEHKVILERGQVLIDQLEEYIEDSEEKPDTQNSTENDNPTGHNDLKTRTETDGQSHLERVVNEVENDDWHIIVRFGENTFRDGMDPLSFILFLEKLGSVTQIRPLIENIPNKDLFDPESCYLGFEIQFLSKAKKQEIEDVFEFMKEDGYLHILPPNSALSDYLDEILIECGALTQFELEAALNKQSQIEDKQPLSEMLAEENVILSPVLEAASIKQNKVCESVTREQKCIRVDADKLDILINYVGELVTASASTVLQADLIGDSQMIESVTLLNNLLEEVRDAALKLRMVPIGASFTKFQRVVRDTAKELGKDVDLIIKGAETELDKAVVEKIGDPLMHLVRNSLDHGIETPEIRQRKGKPSKGELTLNAYHDSGNIIIEVSDDGKGLDPEVLFRKAIEKGLINEDAQLSRMEKLNLIFEPGFSTATQVTNISGRGVGMDVVKRNITELRGRIDIESVHDKGTTIRIVLPLTLAIIDGFMIGVGQDTFVVPLDLIQECVDLDDYYLKKNEQLSYINLRGEVLPLVNLREHFDLIGTQPSRQSVVVVKVNGLQGGLIVDRLMGEFQTVIKPLGKVFERVTGLSGSTILGTGKVALILDIQGLIRSLSKTSPETLGRYVEKV
jgi:two-component system chemotaxis sensor kinase CheA